MAKDKLTDYDSTASSNLDVGGISVAEGMLPSGVNNAIREQMSHLADAFGAGTPLYVDQTNNRLGIGTASPSALLHLDGTTPSIFMQPSADTEVAAIRFRNAADSNTQGMIEYNHSENSMSFRTNGVSDRVFINSSGYVGIGTSSPASDVGLSKVVEIEAATAGFKATATGGSSMEVYSASTASYVDTTTNHPIIFRPNKSEAMRIRADGEVTKPYQPSFMVSKSSDQTLVIGSETNIITWENETWDVGGNFDIAANEFVAPVTGKYYLQTQLRIDNLDTATSIYVLKIITSNRTKQFIIDPNFASDLIHITLSVSSVFDMDASDIAYVGVVQFTGTASHIEDSASYTSFSGYLLG